MSSRHISMRSIKIGDARTRAETWNSDQTSHQGPVEATNYLSQPNHSDEGVELAKPRIFAPSSSCVVGQLLQVLDGGGVRCSHGAYHESLNVVSLMR